MAAGASGAEAGCSEACFLSTVCKAAEAQPGLGSGQRKASHAAVICAPRLDYRTSKKSWLDAREPIGPGGYPAWGFVVVRTYYASEEQWQAFRKRLDVFCNAQIDEEIGEGLQYAKDTLEFKMIEDPRLEGVGHTQARKHFHAARTMGDVAAGLDLDLMILVDEDVIKSFLADGAQSSSGTSSPYLVAVDVTESPSEGTPEGYPGFFRVSMDALLSELYPKLCMGLSAKELWAMLGDGQVLWIGDDE
ncbi:hypothetical protein PG997_003521 [Apiospora hydei]|uniref:Uncharacterized protein n=1 Tax=Apiospora hydei TaxID=1337664 RepID=A0ABR1WZK3_9PEZI